MLKNEVPWHAAAWRQLMQAVNGQRLPHALLLTGPVGTGKREFAASLSQLLLCKSPDFNAMRSCDSCDSCKKSHRGFHPDYLRISQQEGKREILVDDVRNLLKFINLSTHVAKGYKVVVIDPADKMTRSAANALLKTLEEPPANRVIILISGSHGNIPATIRSRCQLLRIPVPKPDVARQWLARELGTELDAAVLERYDNAVFKILSLYKADEGAEVIAEDEKREREWEKQWIGMMQSQHSVLKVAQEWADLEDQHSLIHWLLRESLKSVRGIFGIGGQKNRDIFSQPGFGLESLLYIQNRINELHKLSNTTINAKLMWETFLLDCHRMVKETS